MARRHAEVFLGLLSGEGFAEPNPRPMFPNPPGLLRLEPHSPGLRDRIWWGTASNATATWAARLGMNMQTSTLKFDESGQPLHLQQTEQINAFREAWREAGHQREPRVSVSRSIFALVDDRDRAYFGHCAAGDRSDRLPGRDDARHLRPHLRRGAGRPGRAAGRGHRHRGRRHAAADRSEPAGRRLQRARHREHPDPRGARPRLALNPCPAAACAPRRGRMSAMARFQHKRLDQPDEVRPYPLGQNGDLRARRLRGRAHDHGAGLALDATTCGRSPARSAACTTTSATASRARCTSSSRMARPA